MVIAETNTCFALLRIICLVCFVCFIFWKALTRKTGSEARRPRADGISGGRRVSPKTAAWADVSARSPSGRVRPRLLASSGRRRLRLGFSAVLVWVVLAESLFPFLCNEHLHISLWKSHAIQCCPTILLTLKPFFFQIVIFFSSQQTSCFLLLQNELIQMLN